MKKRSIIQNASNILSQENKSTGHSEDIKEAPKKIAPKGCVSLQETINRIKDHASISNTENSVVTEEDESHAQKSLDFRKRGISFKDPTPVKQPILINKQLMAAPKLLDSPLKRAPLVTIRAGTNSASKSAYASLIDSSNII